MLTPNGSHDAMDNYRHKTTVVEKLKQGDPLAAHELWHRYFKRLIRVAHEELGNAPRRVEDEEDTVQSALHGFFQFARQGRFPNLRSARNLWPLLYRITQRQAINQRKRQLAQKRGGGRVRGDSVFDDEGAGGRRGGLDKVEGLTSPEQTAVDQSDQIEHLLSLLHTDSLRAVATLKLQGFTNQQVADILGVVVRTVERKLNFIRRRWSEPLQDHGCQ